MQTDGSQGTFDLGDMLMGKVSDAPYVELPGLKINLPQWDPVQLGPILIDFSPTKNVVWMALAGLLCLAVFLTVAGAYKRAQAGGAPTGFTNAMEALIVFFRDQVVRANIGHGADAFTPYILSLFFFILFMNLLGLIPFGISATANLSVTAALAFLSLILIEVAGYRALGPKGYLGTIFYAPHGMPPLGRAIMMVIMTPVEFIGKLTKPFALAIRLFANMTAGKVLILSLLGLIFVFGDLAVGRWGIAGGSVIMTSAIMLLKVFVAFLQAFIFSMLTAVFIGLIRHAH